MANDKQEAPYVIVTNTEPRRRSIQYSTQIDGRTVYPDPIQLKPGANIVPRAAWAEAKKLGTIRIELDSGVIREGGDFPAGGLAMLSAPAAVALIGEVLDTVALRQWSREETRPDVQRAIDVQLGKIDAAGRADRPEAQPWESGKAPKGGARAQP